ncbi:hypothetical protein K505DRAFT_321021 [Melanomma pulvis-pyrius CBS 109.77]|uniref:Uncharacterized protein n=1 Tax=Melanomma pulvis-pyrius CBS 109.77 TaxID=1314802 RepID=A0A6A6XUJ9_9PLEO|nr:hypothetical protein K505DRAFT_321021 [Melanomma pulvis-pyrius CBS 109.77]
MAPLEPGATAHTNSLPFALFSGQIVLVAGLTTHLLLTARRAARSLPPSTVTRTQEPTRRRHVAVFSVLALLSLASVTTFAVAWRVLSYVTWAETGNHEGTPGGLWTGNYGTGAEGVGRWHLGDWTSDIDLFRASDAVAVGTPEGFLYTAQHFVGLTAMAIFVGVEGHRRNLSTLTITSFVTLSAIGSLGYALNLLFITVLFTPLVLHNNAEPRETALFTPKPAVYYVPTIASFLTLHYLPTLLVNEVDITPLRFGYLAVPLFLAFAPQIVPQSWGHQHISKASAHRSYVRAFQVLGAASFLLYWKLFATTVFDNTPPQQSSVYDLLKHSIGKHDPSKTDRFLTGIASTADKLKLVSTHPLVSTTGCDVFFATLSLLTWTFTRNLDVDSILEDSILSFLASSKAEKHVAFEEGEHNSEVEDIESDAQSVRATTPKKRGRPRKNTTTNGNTSAVSSASSTGTLRRSTRRKAKSDYESEAESSYEPSTEAKKEVDRTETDGATVTEDLVHSGESTALALFLAFAGGLGQLAAGVLGAEVTGTAEY